MNLNQLRTFVAVANRLSFTLAAEDLDLTQPAVSLQVKALERSVHVRLLERHRNVLSLTEAGKALYDLALTMLSTERKANELLAELSGGRRGKLVIGANTTGGMYVVPELISEFRQMRADASLDLHIEPAARILERIHQNIVDIGFVGGPLVDERFEVEHVAPDALVLIFSPRHPFAGRQQVALHELADQPFIVPEPTSLMRMQFEQAARAAGLQIRIALQLHEGEPVKKAVEANLGVGIISAFAIRRELAAGHLGTAEVEGLRISRHLEMVWRRERYFSPLAVGFRDFARAFFAREYSDGHGAPA